MAEQKYELKVGDKAPEFRLPASDGRELGPGDFQSKTNLILFFVREYI
jgi:peroxiredoxin